jgi:hypothetical protein
MQGTNRSKTRPLVRLLVVPAIAAAAAGIMFFGYITYVAIWAARTFNPSAICLDGERECRQLTLLERVEHWKYTAIYGCITVLIATLLLALIVRLYRRRGARPQSSKVR